ncbi:unnamed protein product [Lupinus luteus]|uniref:HMA domain-containing protein n=1 Tax=Lupinus luteus TaxID=3873 RepID=A0AAV1VVX3_LUPLU
MVPDLQKPRVIEMHVRMDCNGCVQKVKKALNGINGIYDIYIDFPQQKISIIGWADPEKVVKAIKKTRKMATICNIEQPDESPSQPPEPEGNAQPPPSTETPPPQARPSEEPPKDSLQCEQPQPEAKVTQSQATNENNARHESPSTSGIKDVGEVHVIQHHPSNYGFGHSYIIAHKDNTNRYHNGPVFLNEPPDQPVYVSQSYNTYRQSRYVTEYEYARSPPRHHYSHNDLVEYYSKDCYYQHHNGNGNITSIFSDENPNACRIV